MAEPQRLVEIVEYDPNWPKQFEQEAIELKKGFGNNLIAIHHVGSTAVRGLAAKPIIDMLPVVHDIAAVDELNPQMGKLGYGAFGEYGLPGRRYFRKLEGHRHLFHLHTYKSDNPEILRHLVFRDYLRAHPKIASEYGALKIELAQKFKHDPEAYQEGKHDWIQKMEKQALQWHALSKD